MKCIESNSGNLFVCAKAGEVYIYFFIDPKTGDHLDDRKEYHSPDFYRQAVRNWVAKETSLPEENIPHVNAIVEKYLKKEELLGTYMVTTPTSHNGSTLANALISAFEKKK